MKCKGEVNKTIYMYTCMYNKKKKKEKQNENKNKYLRFLKKEMLRIYITSNKSD
jgi:hypothetical protein